MIIKVGGSQQEGQASSKEKSSNSSLNAESISEQENNKFILKSSGVLNNQENINWTFVKSEVEEMYLSIPTLTIDLYNQNIKQEDILSFNKEYDNLTVVTKDEKKAETVTELSKLYDFLPKFIQGEDDLYNIIIETKANIFKAYSKLDSGNWDEILNDVQNAINIYFKLLTNPNIDANKINNINKGYIMLNELQNAVNIKDTSIFLIKYKNLIEELNNY